MNSCTFITRRCFRNCDYCDIANTPGKNELSPEQWRDAFEVLHHMGVKFNLILGNETWAFKDSLATIMLENKVPYALYTTAPPHLFKECVESYFGNKIADGGIIDNLTCGIDYTYQTLQKISLESMDDTQRKSWDGWNAIKETRVKWPWVDCHATITISKRNYMEVEEYVKEASFLGVHVAINFIHWNKDGKYDFFPGADSLKDYLFNPDDEPIVTDLLRSVSQLPHNLIQNKELMEQMNGLEVITMGWHCGGSPYDGPTIDADGSLRCCAYRPGTRTPHFQIFDLWDSEVIDRWRSAVYLDAMDCPGCTWTYPWTYHYWKKRDPSFGTKIFVKHAGKHIPKEKWADRKVE